MDRINLILYRLSPLSGSTGAIGTHWETVSQLNNQKKQSVPMETQEQYVGELNPADLRKVCFENERYKRITISDAQKTTELLEILMGSNVEPRKRYIYDNATALGFNFD